MTEKASPSGRALSRAPDRRVEGVRSTAELLTDGSANTAVVTGYLSATQGGDDLLAVANLLNEQVSAIAAGDVTQLERMLLSQATALQAMFVDLAVRAKSQDHRHWHNPLTTLALQCAAQSRQAITALAELRAPRAVMFAKQANVTTGPQQINNGISMGPRDVARAEGKSFARNELLEATDEQRLVTRAASAAVGNDSRLEAVGAINRPADARRQGKVR